MERSGGWCRTRAKQSRARSSPRSNREQNPKADKKLNNNIFFLLDLGLNRLTSLQFIQYHVAGFYKPTTPQSPPSHLQDNSTCNNARFEFSKILLLALIQMNGA
jgi:hypothetical protein